MLKQEKKTKSENSEEEERYWRWVDRASMGWYNTWTLYSVGCDAWTPAKRLHTKNTGNSLETACNTHASIFASDSSWIVTRVTSRHRNKQYIPAPVQRAGLWFCTLLMDLVYWNNPFHKNGNVSHTVLSLTNYYILSLLVLQITWNVRL